MDNDAKPAENAASNTPNDPGEVLGLARTLVDQLHGLQARLEYSYSAAESYMRAAAVPQAYPAMYPPPPPRPLPPAPPMADWSELQALINRFEKEQQAAVARHEKLEVQTRTLLEGLPALVQQAFQKLEEQNRGRLKHLWAGFQDEREHSLGEMESRLTGAVRQSLVEVRSLDAPMREDLMRVLQDLEATVQKQRGELRFTKSLLWLTGSALVLVFVLVTYTILPRL